MWHVEHHFREGRSHSPAPEVIIGALSQATKNLRLGFGVVLMPHQFCHPVHVAEKVATADVLSGGRVEWGTGRSTPMEQTAFHVPVEESRAEWQEAIEATVQAWREEYFEFHGKYLDFPRRMVTPKPVQIPHPPAWMAATSDGSAAVAGKLGMGLLSFSIMQPITKMAEHIRQYREGAKNPTPLTEVTTNKVAAYTLVHCADSMEQAEANGIWDSVWWWYKNLAEFILEWEVPHLSDEEKEKMFPLLKRQIEGKFDPKWFSEADMIIVGDPETCVEKMVKYAELGVDQLICYVQFGYLSHESVMRTIELLGTKVIPELEKPRHPGVGHRHRLTPAVAGAPTASRAVEPDDAFRRQPRSPTTSACCAWTAAAWSSSGRARGSAARPATPWPRRGPRCAASTSTPTSADDIAAEVGRGGVGRQRHGARRRRAPLRRGPRAPGRDRGHRV